MPKKIIKFEQALTRLHNIVEIIEDSDTTLDESIKLYKEGLTMAQNCGDILGKYEAEVLELKKDADAAFALQPFAEGSASYA